jgi:hypothetical protein
MTQTNPTPTDTTLSGQALQSATHETPRITLRLYRNYITLQHHDRDFSAEYVADPDAVTAALASKVSFSTGIIQQNTLLVAQQGSTKYTIEYREPRLTTLMLEQLEKPIVVPLPGLVLARKASTVARRAPTYSLAAVKVSRHDLDETTPLYHVPLPNIFASTNICWGSIKHGNVEAVFNDLGAGWDALFDTPFNSHGTHGKSESYPDDIRKMLSRLHNEQITAYPLDDLIANQNTLGDLYPT